MIVCGYVTKWTLLIPDYVMITCLISPLCINSLPNDKFLEWSKSKAFADNKIHVTSKLKFVLEKVDNIAGIGENAGYQHFLLFPQCFENASFP